MLSRRRPVQNLRAAASIRRKSKAQQRVRDAAISTSLVAKSKKSRDAILRSAAALFRQQEYSATTLRQIAGLAKTKAGSIYYHFDSKEEIVAEILERGLQHVVDSVKAAVKGA